MDSFERTVCRHLYISIFFGLVCMGGSASAVPRMSLTAASPCATCHLNPTGGGLRTAVGSSTGRGLSLVSIHELALGSRPVESTLGRVLDTDKKHAGSTKVSTGLDLRYQWAHLGAPKAVFDDQGNQRVVEPGMSGFPMQIQPYLGISIAPSLSVYGSYALGPDTHRGEACDTVFAGQSCFDAAIQYDGVAGVGIRAGMIQPSIGIRWDDHTILTRGDAARRRTPLIPPNYAEWGSEINYQPVQELRFEAGVFQNRNLKAALSEGANQARPQSSSQLVRISYMPYLKFGGSSDADTDDWDDDFDSDDEEEDEGDEDDMMSSGPPLTGQAWLGSSWYGSGDFWLLNVFSGLGFNNGFAIYSETAHSRHGDAYTTLNGMVGFSWELKPAIVPSMRFERAQTTDSDVKTVVTSFVASLEFFPLPFVEIRPEYRIVKTEEYIFGQPTIQLHLFY